MSLPPWKSTLKEDQEALSLFVIAELDRMDERPVSEAGYDPVALSYLSTLLESQRLAASIGKLVVDQPRHSRPGPKKREPAGDPFAHAAADVPRIRDIFWRFWGKRNRTIAPLAEDIAALRWELNDEHTAALIDRFRRKG